MKRNNKKSKILIYKLISCTLIIMSVVLISIVLFADLLPQKHIAKLMLSILVFDAFNVLSINIKTLKNKVKKVLSMFMLIAIFIMFFASFYLCKTLGILMNNGDTKYKIENYSVITLKDNNYSKIYDIKNKTIGIIKNLDVYDKIQKEILNKVKADFKSYDSSNSLVEDLLESKVEIIVLEDSIVKIMNEEIEDFSNSIKVIYTFKIKTEAETTKKEVEVTKKPFAIYISGIDTYGEISSVSRSDVNIVMVINSKNHQVLLISIPRDYYVQLHNTSGPKDKLTHAGIYGIDMSIKTIEDLLEMDINYYVKVNFTSVIDIVDALGGLDVYSEYSFISYSDFKFNKGMNYVNGEQALDFARTRKAFVDGDRQRGKNQQAVIEAIIRKATNKSVITKYNSLLNAINGKYQTNISTKKITALIKMQLNDMSPWTVTSYSLTGYDASDYTYTYNQKLYVMKPNQESIEEAKKLINEILNNEELENSYKDIFINSGGNKVTKVYNTTKSEVTIDNSIEKETEYVDDSNEKEILNDKVEKEENLEDDPIDSTIMQEEQGNDKENTNN